MEASTITNRVKELLAKCTQGVSLQLVSELRHGTSGILEALYGPGSIQEKNLQVHLDKVLGTAHPSITGIQKYIIESIHGTLESVLREIDSGLIGSLQSTVTGEVLTDLIQLSRKVLDEAAADGKNVAAVLGAAAFEDTIRRIAAKHGLPEREKLADTLEEMKKNGILKGAQVGIAQSYLGFRNKALHAKWDDVDVSAVQSVLAFTEQLIMAHFS